MTRMSRELSLVLLGAGVLTAAYFAWPERDYALEADKQAEKRVGGRSRSGGTFIFIGHIGGGGGPSSVTGGGRPGMASVSKGGFGSVGGRVGGGSGG